MKRAIGWAVIVLVLAAVAVFGGIAGSAWWVGLAGIGLGAAFFSIGALLGWLFEAP